MTTLTTISSLKSEVVEAMLHELQGEELSCVGDAENIMDGVETGSCGEVIYNHDAWNIIGNSDFAEPSDLDFSDCSDAMACVMQEAQSAVYNTVQDLRNDVQASIRDLLDELFSIDSVKGMYVDRVDVTRGGSTLDHVAHDREEDMSCGDNVVSACFYLAYNAVTVSFEGMTLTARLEPEDDNDDSEEDEA